MAINGCGSLEWLTHYSDYSLPFTPVLSLTLESYTPFYLRLNIEQLR